MSESPVRLLPIAWMASCVSSDALLAACTAFEPRCRTVASSMASGHRDSMCVMIGTAARTFGTRRNMWLQLTLQQ
jgi:hypothetical protein